MNPPDKKALAPVSKPSETPEVPTAEQLEGLKAEIKEKGFLDGVFTSIKDFMDVAVSKFKEFFAGLTGGSFLNKLFGKDKNESDTNKKASPEADPEAPSFAINGAKPITSLNIKSLNSLGLKPENLTFYRNARDIPPCTFGLINRHGFTTPVYCDPNPEQRTGGFSTVMVPVSIVADLVAQGYDLDSKRSMHEFMRSKLVAVRLPRTFTGNKSPIMVNPRIQSSLQRAFDLMASRGVVYDVESAGCMCWRGGRGAGIDRQLDYVAIVGNHGFGTAIDFNPGNNPYKKGGGNDFPPGFVESMEEAGFTWGGRWKTPDSMHFEVKYQDLLA